MSQDRPRAPQLADRVRWSPGSLGWRLLFNGIDRRTTMERLAVLEQMAGEPWFGDRLRRPDSQVPLFELWDVFFRFVAQDEDLFERFAEMWAVGS